MVFSLSGETEQVKRQKSIKDWEGRSGLRMVKGFGFWLPLRFSASESCNGSVNPFKHMTERTIKKGNPHTSLCTTVHVEQRNEFRVHIWYLKPERFQTS